MAGPKNSRTILTVVLVVALQSCGGGNLVYESKAGSDWFSPLSPSELATIRQTFPQFMPELFSPGTDPTNRPSLRPSNFLPARFFGEAVPKGVVTTPQGIQLESNGFDATRQPVQIASAATYFDPQGNPFSLQFGMVEVTPLHEIERRMNLTLTQSPPRIIYDRRDWRVRPDEVDRILLEVRDSLAVRLPSVAGVPLNNCRITIRPTIFYVLGSNLGDTWAGGATRSNSNGIYQLEVSVFYVSSQQVVTDWRAYLIHEAINYFVLSIGRDDLAQ